jgi:FkbH-like protein
MKDLKISEIMERNRSLGKSFERLDHQVIVLSNVTVNGVKDILEYSLRESKIPSIVQIGDFDNIIQDSGRFANSDAVVIFWESLGFIDGFQYKSHLMTSSDLADLVQKIKGEISLLIKNLSQTRLVILNRFSALAVTSSFIRKTNIDVVCAELNQYLESQIPSNFLLIDLDKVLAQTGLDNSFDWRFFYSSKALYTSTFFKNYCLFIRPAILASVGLTKKALFLDCDNTLWGGILGEDGAENLKLGAHSTEGVIYEEIQYLAKYLSKNGVIIGLSSKNNPHDVDHFICSSQRMILKEEDISHKAVNWSDKHANLKAAAKSLNIGLDSFVFVDDSHFEINLVKDLAPEIYSVLVPEKTFQYPKIFRDLMAASFFSLTRTAEDKNKISMYKAEADRTKEKDQFGSIEEYLKSLRLKIFVEKNNKHQIDRISQLTQKTNQFNLTTKRYSTVDIAQFMSSPIHTVYSFSVIDNFGDYGHVGVCILNTENNEATIDTMLMSCRVMGRNVEFAFFNFLVTELKNIGLKRIYSSYVQTAKSIPVESFYEGLGFQLETSNESKQKQYSLKISDYQFKNTEYIEVSTR